nr:unnamed protein product [Callosobruchus chinensis]
MADESAAVVSSDFSKMKVRQAFGHAYPSTQLKVRLKYVHCFQVPDLKKELKMRGLTSGNKTELLEDFNEQSSRLIARHRIMYWRIQLHHKKKCEDASEPESKSLAPPPPKKLILNRNNSCNSETAKPVAVSKEEEPKQKSKNDVAHPEGLEMTKRLELRAKKFGVSAVSTDIKKAVRAERFGLSDNSANSITSDKTAPSVDILQKRAARFGGSVSTVMSSLENKEKLEKRKARFGTVSVTNGTSVSAADKAKERLERFKQPVK